MIRHLTLVLIGARIAGAQAPATPSAPVDRWAVLTELGANVARGNSSYTMVTSGLRFTHLNKTLFELDWASSITYGESEVTVIAHRMTTALKADVLPLGQWSPFVFTALERDRIRKLDLFSNTGVGIKWTFHRTKTDALSVSLAAIHSYKAIIGGAKTTTARLSLRPKLVRKLPAGFSLEQTTFYQPAASDVPDYNVESVTRLNYAASKTSTLFANYSYREDSRPPIGIKREDHLLVAGIKMQF